MIHKNPVILKKIVISDSKEEFYSKIVFRKFKFYFYYLKNRDYITLIFEIRNSRTEENIFREKKSRFMKIQPFFKKLVRSDSKEKISRNIIKSIIFCKF